MKFKVGDTVRLKKEWYKEDVCKRICREIKRAYGTYKNSFTIISVENDFIGWGESVVGKEVGLVVPTQLLEPISTKHKWTKEEINTANQIIGEIVSGINGEEDYLIDDREYESNREIMVMNNDGKMFYSHPSKDDEENKAIGICVALCKAFGREIPKFILGE